MSRLGNSPLNQLSPNRPESYSKTQYRNTNSQSGGGVRAPNSSLGSTDPAYMPRVTSTNSMKPRSLGDYMAQTNPTLARRATSQPYPGMVGYQGPSQKDQQWASRVNGMGSEELNSLIDPNVASWGKASSPESVASRPYKSGAISVEPGRAMSNRLLGYRYGPGSIQNVAAVPQQSVSPGQSVWPMKNQYVRSELATAPQQGIDRQSPVWQQEYESKFNEAMQADRQRQVDGANNTVDRNLQASDRLGRTMGGADYRAAGRTGVIGPRGMGALPGDAEIMERNSRPLGDGGPAAAAAAADKERRRLDAEAAMGGKSPDGLTRYMPNQDLLNFANEDRAKEDAARGAALGAAGYDPAIAGKRDPMKAMTTDDIRFYRHKYNMATNKAYADRVNQQRADREEMQNNRREMARARRAGALEAAGSSQQMRNLMAGRGALAGQDGFNALLGLAAMQNPNMALRDYGPAYQAQAMPGMLDQRLQAEENMLNTRAGIDRMQQYETMRMQIISSGAPDIEKQRALNSLNNYILMGGGLFGPQGFSEQGGMGQPGVVMSNGVAIPNWIQPPQQNPDGDTTPTIQRFADYMKSLRANAMWQQLPEDQKQAIEGQIKSVYFPGITQADIAQYVQDNETNPLSRLYNWAASLVGRDGASVTKRQENLDAINPYRAGVATDPGVQDSLTQEEIDYINQFPDSNSRMLAERYLRERKTKSNPQLPGNL